MDCAWHTIVFITLSVHTSMRLFIMCMVSMIHADITSEPCLHHMFYVTVLFSVCEHKHCTCHEYHTHPSITNMNIHQAEVPVIGFLMIFTIWKLYHFKVKPKINYNASSKYNETPDTCFVTEADTWLLDLRNVYTKR